MAKPTVLPRWANSGGSVVTPSSGKLDIGWLPKEKPPAQYFNWLGLHTYNWLNWLNNLFPSDNLVLDANKSVQVSGTGYYKRGTFYRHIPLVGVTGSGITQGRGYVQTTTGTVVYIPLVVNSGEQINAVQIRVQDAGADTLNFKVWRINNSGGTHVETQLGSTASSVGSGGSNQDVTVSGLTETVGALDGLTYLAEITISGTGSGIIANTCIMTLNIP